MKIDIAKEDLWWLRDILSKAIDDMEMCPNPSAYGKSPSIARKINRKLNVAIKKAFGHDMHAEWYNYKKVESSSRTRKACYGLPPEISNCPFCEGPVEIKETKMRTFTKYVPMCKDEFCILSQLMNGMYFRERNYAIQKWNVAVSVEEKIRGYLPANVVNIVVDLLNAIMNECTKVTSGNATHQAGTIRRIAGDAKKWISDKRIHRVM